MSSKRVVRLSLLIGALVIAFLFWWIYFRESSSTSLTWVSYLPALNAFLNSCTAALLIFGYVSIKNNNRSKHKKLMISATITSGLFLISYLTYHYFQGDTKFLAVGFLRYIYFFILITHIVLSIIQVPLILMTLIFAFTEKLKLHRKVAPWTFWIWLYVSITGVLVFIFLKYFNS